MNNSKNTFFIKVTIILFSCFVQLIGNTQVTSVKYMIRFNDTTQHFDAYLVVEAGNATTVPQRTQFNTQYSLVVPTGSTLSVAEKFLPLLGNQNYNGNTPADWRVVVSIFSPLSYPQNDYHSIIPSISPATHYNNIFQGDTLKLFSLNISPIPQCKQEVRIYQNGIDPTSQDPSFMGGDFSNGFTIGGGQQRYNGNIVGNIIPIPTVEIMGLDTICPFTTTDISASSTGEWSSIYPNIASVTNDGVATGLSEGNARFIFRDIMTGCRSLPTDIIRVLKAPNVFVIPFICAGNSYILTPNLYKGPFTPSPNNPEGGTITENNGIYSFAFSDETSGTFDYFPSGMACPDTIRIIVNPRPIVSFTGSQNICVGQTTNLTPTTAGVWLSNNPTIAYVSNNGLVTSNSPGTVSFIYTSTMSGCQSLPTSPLLVSPLPTVNVTRDTIFVGKTASLTPNSGGTWYSNDTAKVKIINNSLAAGISVGNTSIYFVSDVTTCVSKNVNLVVTDPISTIVGFAFRDVNGNGIFDSQTDSALPNCAIIIASLNATFYTDKTGYYNLRLAPDSYILDFSIPYGNWTNNIITKTVNANSAIEYVFIGFKPKVEEPNALVTISPSNLICNNLEKLDVSVFNNTSQVVSGYLGIQIDDKTFVASSNPFPVGASDNILFWEFIDLLPGNTFTPNIILDIPLPQMASDSLFFKAFSISQAGDTLSTFVYADAINCGQTTQNMLNWPNRPGEENFTLREEVLDYLIRFENTNSTTINNITVVNTLDKNIDVSTILIKESSHNMTTTKEGDKMYFVFENINLSGTQGLNDGYVSFQCKFKNDLADGTIINNLAELNFDGNIVNTNNAINTIVSKTPCFTQSIDVSVCPSNGYSVGQTTYYQAGTYGEILAGAGACDTFQTVNISLLSEPSIGLSQQGNVLIVEGNGSEYYWYECSKPDQLLANTVSFTPNQNGSYFVIVKGEFCSSKSECLDFVLSSSKDLLKANIQIYPNPVNDQLTINSNLFIEQITVRDILGKVQFVTNTNKTAIDFGNFVNGIYLLEINTAHGTLISKVVKH